MKRSTTTLAFFRRELQASLSSRMLLAVPLIGLVVGFATLLSTTQADLPSAAPLFLLQATLYGLPLASILIATGSAHSESAESLLLASLPAPRGARILGKFLALQLCFLMASAFAIAPAAIMGLPFQTACLLFGYSVGTSALFISIGLCVGFFITDGIKSHLASLGAWFLLTIGASLLGYLLATQAQGQTNPTLWSALMMLSPLDALRIGVLFSIESIPFDTADLPSIARWWLAHPGVWFAILVFGATSLFLSLSDRASRPR
ncbi:hypothetical protein [Pelagicoccus sp. SDUM812003]|uniref:hypothetical protein n=1 Tax=Pelagicoccus sp. SDUM812003 TaxID=3041267 RepID=UPI00280F2B07|nr:hypothetical protein [Pelagicoccus sp. SDUM812003]MDQ8202223.1 hypothetical protein [Pelagicoccus sp. SDUM812003]